MLRKDSNGYWVEYECEEHYRASLKGQPWTTADHIQIFMQEETDKGRIKKNIKRTTGRRDK